MHSTKKTALRRTSAARPAVLMIEPDGSPIKPGNIFADSGHRPRLPSLLVFQLVEVIAVARQGERIC